MTYRDEKDFKSLPTPDDFIHDKYLKDKQKAQYIINLIKTNLETKGLNGDGNSLSIKLINCTDIQNQIYAAENVINSEGDWILKHGICNNGDYVLTITPNFGKKLVY